MRRFIDRYFPSFTIFVLWGSFMGWSVWVAAADTPRELASPPANSLRVVVGRWHDADTPKDCLIYLPLGVVLDEPDGVRASDYDAWEVGHRPGKVILADEKARGRRALADLLERYDGGTLHVTLPAAGGVRDKYGRPLGSFWLKNSKTKRWENVGDWIKTVGHQRSD